MLKKIFGGFFQDSPAPSRKSSDSEADSKLATELTVVKVQVQISAATVFLGKGKQFVQFTFDTQDAAILVSTQLFKDKLAGAKAGRAPNVVETAKGFQTYEAGTYFFRLHHKEYPAVAKKYGLLDFDKLKPYEAPKTTDSQVSASIVPAN